LKVGSGPVEVGQDFYQKTQVSCLGCAVHVAVTRVPARHTILMLCLTVFHTMGCMCVRPCES
jgi:hypothetical protein